MLPEPVPITPRAQRLAVIAIVFAVAMGVYLRWWNLGGESLWFDEGFTAWLASQSPSEIIRLVRADTSPPLYYLLLHGWMKLFGGSEVALRSLSATCATLAILFVYGITKRLKLSLPATAITLAVLAMSVLQVRYAREARFYALMSLLASIQLFAVVAYRDRRSPWMLAWFILSSVAMLYTHNMAMPYVGMGLIAWWALSTQSPKRLWMDLSAIVACIAPLFSPWMLTLISQMQSVNGQFWVERPGVAQLARACQVIFGLRDDYASHIVASISSGRQLVDEMSLTLVAFLLGVAAIAACRNRVVAALIAYAVAPVVFVFFYSRFRTPLMIDRVFMPSSIAIAVLAGLLLTHRRLTQGALICAIVLAGVSSVGFIGHERKEDWRSAVRFIESTDTHSDRAIVFLANEGELLYRYYQDPSGPEQVTGLPIRFLADDTPKAMRRVRSTDDLRPLLHLLNEGTDEIVLVLCHAGRDRDKLALRLLEKNRRLIDKRRFHEISVLRYWNDRPTAQIELP